MKARHATCTPGCWAYTAGYLVYVVIAGIRAGPRMTWPEWWADLALEAGWNAAFWPYYFPPLLGFGSSPSGHCVNRATATERRWIWGGSNRRFNCAGAADTADAK